jgi:hypothetical protein
MIVQLLDWLHWHLVEKRKFSLLSISEQKRLLRESWEGAVKGLEHLPADKEFIESFTEADQIIRDFTEK